jgi:hypothetical protein
MLDELVTQKYKLDDINEAMKDLRAARTFAASSPSSERRHRVS